MDSVSAIICWQDKTLLFHRDNRQDIPHPDHWQLPGGGIEKGEKPFEAIVRELQEEVTYVPKKLNLLTSIQMPDRTAYVYASFINADEVNKFKLGEDEGSEIQFLTVDEALKLKLTPTIKFYLEKYKEEIKKALRVKTFSGIKF